MHVVSHIGIAWYYKTSEKGSPLVHYKYIDIEGTSLAVITPHDQNVFVHCPSHPELTQE